MRPLRRVARLFWGRSPRLRGLNFALGVIESPLFLPCRLSLFNVPLLVIFLGRVTNLISLPVDGVTPMFFFSPFPLPDVSSVRLTISVRRSWISTCNVKPRDAGSRLTFLSLFVNFSDLSAFSISSKLLFELIALFSVRSLLPPASWFPSFHRKLLIKHRSFPGS